MLSFSLITWIAFFILLVTFWWQSDKISSIALAIATQHCRDHKLQLLDQSLVINGIWPQRNEWGVLGLRRKYRFEFTSTGEQRYKGTIVLVGKNKLHIELEAHITPYDEDME